MRFTAILTKSPNAPWRARVPFLPGCEAEGATREEALAAIKEHLAVATQHIELVQIEAPASQAQNGAGAEKTFAETWPGFGAYSNDPNWGEFFAELDQQRQ